MVIEDVNRTVRARIIADGLGNIFDLIDVVEAPAAVLAESRRTQSEKPIEKIESSEH
jgi:hypothetical protein